MSEPERHVPDLEDLAAYVDGRLSAERRAWVEEHLVRDEELYEVFMATVEFQKEHGRGLEKSKLGWSYGQVLTALAAAALLLLAIGVSLWPSTPTADTWARRLNPAAIVALKENWSDPGWSRMRGDPADCAYPPETIAFRLGAWTFDLRLALAAGDLEETRTLGGKLGFLTECAELFQFTDGYYQLSARPALHVGDPQLDPIPLLEQWLVEHFADDPLEAHRFRLGGWAEAGRIAAITGDAKALTHIIRNHPEADEIPEIAPHFANLEAIAKHPKLEKEDLIAADEAFRAILYQLAG